MSETVPGVPAAPAASPARLMQLAWGFAPPLIIEAAVESGFFDAVAGRSMNASELAAATNCSERGVTAVMDSLIGLALAARNQDGRYVLTAESQAFLTGTHPASLAPFFRHCSRDLMGAWPSITECVRTGQPVKRVDAEQSGAEFFRDFVEALFPIGYQAALAVARSVSFPPEAAINVLDIAAGSGVWSIALAQSFPNARVTAVDWERVLPVTRKVTAQHGLAGRYKFVSGDILEADFGSGYDVATLGQILHSEGDRRSAELLKKVFRALKPGGTIVIADFLANEDRTGPPQALIFSVNMLVHTSTGRAFTFQEIAAWLAEAGFETPRLLDIPAPSVVLATKPA